MKKSPLQLSYSPQIGKSKSYWNFIYSDAEFSYTVNIPRQERDSFTPQIGTNISEEKAAELVEFLQKYLEDLE